MGDREDQQAGDRNKHQTIQSCPSDLLGGLAPLLS